MLAFIHMENRSLALDVFRGLTVILMILVNNPGSWDFVYPPLKHAPWHGMTPADLVFPFFLFAVGNALAIVGAKLTPQKILKRALIIFLIGLGLNWLPFFVWSNGELIFKSWTWINSDGIEVGIRVMGVLQRIALSYGVAGLLCFYLPKIATRLSFILGILVFYFLLCLIFGGADPFSLSGWFGTQIDRNIFGDLHLYQGEGIPFDPEGLVSTIPCIAQVLLGAWVGKELISKRRDFFRTMAIHSIAFLAVGLVWSLWFPWNKKIWSSSYVLVTTAQGIYFLLLLVWFLDIKKIKNGSVSFVEAFGKNPLFIFVLSGFIPRVLGLIPINPLSWFYEHFCRLIPGAQENASLFYSILMILFYGLIAMVMDKKKIYIKV